MNENILACVRAHPFVAGMTAHHIELLANCASFVQFGECDVIFRAGGPANGFYLIESGAVALEEWVLEHGPVTTDTLPAGDPLGWSWLFPPYLWHYSARAIAPVTAFFFEKRMLESYRDQDLTFGYELLKRTSEIVVRRLQSSRAKLLEALHEMHHRP